MSNKSLIFGDIVDIDGISNKQVIINSDTIPTTFTTSGLYVNGDLKITNSIKDIEDKTGEEAQVLTSYINNNILWSYPYKFKINNFSDFTDNIRFFQLLFCLQDGDGEKLYSDTIHMYLQHYSQILQDGTEQITGQFVLTDGIKLKVNDIITYNSENSEGTEGNFLKKTSNGIGWSDIIPSDFLSPEDSSKTTDLNLLLYDSNNTTISESSFLRYNYTSKSLHVTDNINLTKLYASNNIGIGIEIPNHKLHVNNGNICISNSLSQIIMEENSDSSYNKLYMEYDSTKSAKYFYIYPHNYFGSEKDNGNSFNYLLTEGGKFGLGIKPNPNNQNYKFEVGGNISIEPTNTESISINGKPGILKNYMHFKLNSNKSWFIDIQNKTSSNVIRGTGDENEGSFYITSNQLKDGTSRTKSGMLQTEITNGIGIKYNSSIRWFSFTGQHFVMCYETNNYDKVGLIVSAGYQNKYVDIDFKSKINISEALPYCEISKTEYDIKVFGVISKVEDTGYSRNIDQGSIEHLLLKYNNEKRAVVNSIGEGGIWITNINGNLQNGNFITSSIIPGYGMKQTLNENVLCNYTVAKITCDCNFSLTKVPKQKVKLLNNVITYEKPKVVEETRTIQKEEIVFDEDLQRYVKKIITETITEEVNVFDEYDLYDEQGNIIDTHKVQSMETISETVNDVYLNANGDIEFEDELDENGNQILDYEFNTRFIDENGVIIETEADYLTRQSNGENVYIACFVGCTYHCG